jgi:heme-degrading monooxygenase HmoA
MVITVTSLKLRRLWGFFRLTYLAMFIVRQTKTQPGFITMKNTGFGHWHFTLSAWESAEDARRFAHSGAHQEAMKFSRELASEIRIYTYPGDHLPNWNEAKQLVAERGTVFSFSD